MACCWHGRVESSIGCTAHSRLLTQNGSCQLVHCAPACRVQRSLPGFFFYSRKTWLTPTARHCQIRQSDSRDRSPLCGCAPWRPCSMAYPPSFRTWGSTKSQKDAFRSLWALTLASIAILTVPATSGSALGRQSRDPLALITSSPAERASNANCTHAFPNATLLRSIHHSPLRTSYPGCAAPMCFPYLSICRLRALFLHMGLSLPD